VVGVYVATKSEERNANRSSEAWSQGNRFPLGDYIPPDAPFPIVPRPTSSPVAQQERTSGGSASSMNDGDILIANTVTPVSSNTFSPTTNPRVLNEPTIAPTSTPSSAPTPLISTIYVTAGILPNTDEISETLSNLPGTVENSFLIHLGDWNNVTDVSCDGATFEAVSDFYRRSSLPVYFVVGDNGTFLSVGLGSVISTFRPH